MLGNNSFINKNNINNDNENTETYFEQGFWALCLKRPMEAAHYFCLIENKDNSAIFFNLAICFFISKSYETAYQYLEKALSKLPRKMDNALLDKNFSTLKIVEEENDSYKNAMLYHTPITFPVLAREQIIRLMVDVLYILGNKQEMLNKIASLKYKNYKNIKDKL